MRSILSNGIIVGMLASCIEYAYANEPSSNTPRIEILEAHYDFGVVQPADDSWHTFHFSNGGSDPLEILDIECDCDCLIRPGFPKNTSTR